MGGKGFGEGRREWGLPTSPRQARLRVMRFHQCVGHSVSQSVCQLGDPASDPASQRTKVTTLDPTPRPAVFTYQIEIQSFDTKLNVQNV